MAWLNQHEKPFALKGPSGSLEGVWGEPPGGFSDIAVVCHPNPLEGGTFDNKVVTTLCRAFLSCSIATVRFNFHGVGQSAGTFSGEVQAVADAEAVWESLKQAYPDSGCWMAGFSFGSYAAAQLAQTHANQGLILIAPPVDRLPFAKLGEGKGSIWVLQGELDEVVPPQAVYQWAAQRPAITLIRFPQAGHFFHGRLIELRDQIVDIITLTDDE